MVQVMTRYRSLHPINSLKHVIDVQGGLVAAAQTVVPLADATENAVSTVAIQVDQGSEVSSIFLNVQVAATGTAALANVYMALMKNPGNNIPAPQANLIGVSDNRKHILHQEMIMTEKNTTAIPRTLFKGVIKIPRSKKRMGIDDQIVLLLFAPGVNFDFCIQCIYKEIR